MKMCEQRSNDCVNNTQLTKETRHSQENEEKLK